MTSMLALDPQGVRSESSLGTSDVDSYICKCFLSKVGGGLLKTRNELLPHLSILNNL